MRTGIDILENELTEKYPQVLNILLLDQTTQQNIFWATKNYEHLGELYNFHSQILPELITGDYGSIIMPRIHKAKILQQSRSKEMAEIFTPSWICNTQNNLFDNVWFGRENVFNTKTSQRTWEVTTEKISFPSPKTWIDYIQNTHLEIACGEAPYITSRYDSATGEFIQVQKRIGIIDRKLRVINENANSKQEWLNAAKIAFKHTYAFEWQGDSLLLAREAMLITFIENFIKMFEKEPSLKAIQNIASIISWNVWQMDGIKGVVPDSCTEKIQVKKDLFGIKEKIKIKCKGCDLGNILLHNGKYCKIKDWVEKNNNPKSNSEIKRFIDLFTK